MGSHQKPSIIKGFVTHFTNFPDMKVIRVDERFTSKWQFNPCLITD
jgi:putative Holliday junction resolvase